MLVAHDTDEHANRTQFRNYKLVYRRYAGLFFCVCVDANDNELAYLEAIHLFVEVLGMSFPFHPYPLLTIASSLTSPRLLTLAHSSACASADAFFGNVCELDLVFNFYKVYAILDEVFLAGEIEETSKHVVLARLDQRKSLLLFSAAYFTLIECLMLPLFFRIASHSGKARLTSAPALISVYRLVLPFAQPMYLYRRCNHHPHSRCPWYDHNLKAELLTPGSPAQLATVARSCVLLSSTSASPRFASS